MEIDDGTKLGVGGGGRLRLMRLRLQKIESQMAKFKIHDFAQSKKQTFGSALFVAGEKFQFFCNLSF